jgi:hypothetical protein
MVPAVGLLARAFATCSPAAGWRRQRVATTHPGRLLRLLWIDGGGTWLCGPDTRSWAFDLPPGTAMSGVRFRPGAAADVLSVDACELRDVRVALADLLGSSAHRALAERLEGAAGPA